MPSIQKSIIINATHVDVFNILVDVIHWHTWTRSIISAEIMDNEALKIGSKVRLYQPRKRPVIWELTDLQDGRGFTWETRTFGLKVTSSYWVASAVDSAKVDMSVAISGWLSPILFGLTWAVAENFMEMEIQGLKRHVEMHITQEKL